MLVKVHAGPFISLRRDPTKQIPLVNASADSEPALARAPAVWAGARRFSPILASCFPSAATRQRSSHYKGLLQTPAASTSGASECNSLCMWLVSESLEQKIYLGGHRDNKL
ncbi:hypothetical protein EYF80_014527 [Liparis tanakae]|uniref:Uncharacterized protein n=1 Tax=Liparis tanakae TaxID=230148 RepID=A0A4Z2IBL6_9TELE|nr:hypothetical protein EYF80_014527 [Liparis tanakae]